MCEWLYENFDKQLRYIIDQRMLNGVYDFTNFGDACATGNVLNGGVNYDGPYALVALTLIEHILNSTQCQIKDIKSVCLSPLETAVMGKIVVKIEQSGLNVGKTSQNKRLSSTGSFYDKKVISWIYCSLVVDAVYFGPITHIFSSLDEDSSIAI